MTTLFAMTDKEYAGLLEYEIATGEAPQYYIDPRRLGDYLDLTNIDLNNIAESECPVEQDNDHESVRAGSVRIKSEPLSEEGITAARTGSVEVKVEELSEDGVGEVEWVDVLPPMAKSPEIKQEIQKRGRESEYILTLPKATTPPATTPWTIAHGGFAYYPPSPPTTEPVNEDEDEYKEETVFSNAARDLQCQILHIDKGHRAEIDDIEMPDAEEADKVDTDTEMGGFEETAEEKTPMDCTPDRMSLERALLHPDTTSKLKAARCRRSPVYRRTPSNGSLSSIGSSSSRRSRRCTQSQKKDEFRETLHKIREFSVERVVVQASPFGRRTRSPSDFVDRNSPYKSSPTPVKTHQAVKRRHKIGKPRWLRRVDTIVNVAVCVSALDPVYFPVVRFEASVVVDPDHIFCRDELLSLLIWAVDTRPLSPPWNIISSHTKSVRATIKEISSHGATSTKSKCFSTDKPAEANVKSESRNPRRPPEESGPFGRRRNARYDHARSRTRTGTPAKKENPSVAEFSRLFSQQQEDERANNTLPKSSSSGTLEGSRKVVEKVATECILYGYKTKETEWKVIDKYERISQGMICEDYPRNDPAVSNKYSQLLSGGDVVIRSNLSADANRKSKRYAGGLHWIKVTFDSTTAADRACFFSPQEIDGHLVFCELYHGQGPADDIPIPKESAEATRTRSRVHHTLTSTHSTAFLSNIEPERSTLPRSFGMGNLAMIGDVDDGDSQLSTPTASSATATAVAEPSFLLRQRSVQDTQLEQKPESEFMTHIPNVRRAVLRPVSEALPPQPTVTERVLRSIPILSWFTGDIVGDGPQLGDDGKFDYNKSTFYWRFWFMVDQVLGTDICGLREES